MDILMRWNMVGQSETIPLEYGPLPVRGNPQIAKKIRREGGLR